MFDISEFYLSLHKKQNTRTMARILNNGKTILSLETEEAKITFDRLAGRIYYGTFYEIYLETAAMAIGLENGTIELEIDGTITDDATLIQFNDGKTTPRCAQPINIYK